MALSDRQKQGVGFLIASVVFAILGIICLAVPNTPTWVPVLVDVVWGAAGVLGVVLVAKPSAP
jgi:hypothetical protein